MIKAIFFDLYNTLARFHPPREDIQVVAAKEFGLEVEPEGIVRGYAKADAFMTQQNSRLHIQKMSPEDRLSFFAEYERLILEGAGADVSTGLARDIWTRVRAVPSHLAVYDDVLPILIELKDRDLILGVISNMYQDLDIICENMGIAPLLSFKVSSRTAGAEKPHPPIFLAALREAGVEPAEAIHVGDQYNGDIVGARNVGIHPILLDRDGLLDEYDDVDRIRTLGELPAFV